MWQRSRLLGALRQRATQAREQALGDAEEEWLRNETPLGALDEMQMALVLEADDLYEMFQVDPDADVDTIRRAYRARLQGVASGPS